MKNIDVFDNFLGGQKPYHCKGSKLIVLMGSLGDFDSFEYAQQLSQYYFKLKKLSIELFIVGIGSELSKKRFCEFNSIKLRNLYLVKDSTIHNQLKLSKGLHFSKYSIVNLILMCAGIESPGTLREVLRGYTGDSKSRSIFSDTDQFTFFKYLKFNGSMFNLLNNNDSLRPFELATRRLLNMLEILNNWNIYNFDPSYLCQRGATFLLDESNSIVYSYKSSSLLSYAENMRDPLYFLDSFANTN